MPLRILHVTPYYEQAWAYGGIPRIVTALANAQANLGHTVTVCTTDAGDQRSRVSSGSTTAPGAPSVRVFRNASNRLAHDLQCFLPYGMWRYLRDRSAEFDVAHIHACRHLPGSFAARALSRASIPYVLAPNGTAPRIERRVLAKRAYDRLLGARDLAGAARVIAVSEHERRQLVEAGVEAPRVRLIPNPVCLTEHQPPVRGGSLESRARAVRGPVVLYLGRLSPRKRLDVLVRAFARLGPMLRLIIAGSDMGAERPTRRLVEALGLQERVEFPGVLVGRQRLEALATATVVAYASENEIFGLVPLEAILCGTPVVVGDDSGCASIIEAVGGGRAVPVGDVPTLAEALADVFREPERWDRLVRAAASQVRARYDDRIIATQVLAVYGELLAA